MLVCRWMQVVASWGEWRCGVWFWWGFAEWKLMFEAIRSLSLTDLSPKSEVFKHMQAVWFIMDLLAMYYFLHSATSQKTSLYCLSFNNQWLPCDKWSQKQQTNIIWDLLSLKSGYTSVFSGKNAFNLASFYPSGKLWDTFMRRNKGMAITNQPKYIKVPLMATSISSYINEMRNATLGNIHGLLTGHMTVTCHCC